ncbi:serine hydrolase domain-containing protein [Lysobacter sp. GCM10012299]|uniref:serine hydrolase domain-containing protein n=1 Tax=Lysobacter sp. GCM10012299 TaxID=3317333 RepID=UPI003618AA4C
MKMSLRVLLLSVLFLSPVAIAQAPVSTLDPEAFVADYAAKHDFNGTVLVKRRGEVVYSHSFGEANIALGVPNTRQTRYRIASITKLFTATLVMQLYEEEKLDPGRTIATYLPDYAGPAAQRVTVHQLLNHTSGIDNMDKVTSAEQAITEGIPAYQHPWTSDQLLSRFSSGPLVHEPGKVFDYNNGDYVILGKIVERLRGKPFDEVLDERILKPLGMADSGMLRQSDIVKGLASTYFMRDDLKRLANDLPVYPENWYAAGGMYSTVDDVLRFSDALFAGRLLKQATLAKMFAPGLDDYGYGVWSYTTKVDGKPYRVVKRPGQIMGAQAQLYRFLDADLTVVILSNTGTTDLDEFVAAIGKRYVAVPAARR